MLVVLTITIFGRAYNDLFCYAFLVLGFIPIIFFSTEECFYIIVYLLTLAKVMKFGVDDMSFYTYHYFAFLFRILVLDVGFEIDRVSFVALVLMGFYGIVFSGYYWWTTVLTIVTGLLLIKLIDRYNINADSAVVAYGLGAIAASVLGLLRDSSPALSQLIRSSSMKVDEDVYADRFSGLLDNPNYFTMDIVFIIACIVVLLLAIRQRPIHYILIAALTVFGVMSVSKSFLISYALVLVLWFIGTLRKGGASRATKFAFFAVILIGVVYYFAFDSINLFLFRFEQDENASLNSISTGRLDIWVTYIKEVFENPKIFLFGKGLWRKISDGRAPHNTFLETIFYFGFFGTSLFLFCLKKSFEGMRMRAVLLIPISVLVLRMFAISLLTYDNIWIYLVIIKLLADNLEKQAQSAPALAPQREKRLWFSNPVKREKELQP
ncbi:MAG: O-antigen ligase family protein [Clostridia bacterium]|nr:O-antigen ligase family protein [Clostridia bacterium]